MASIVLGGSVHLDIERLLLTRLLLQANSGGGKSYGMRRLLEQTHGKVLQIVLDTEGEFHTLREKFDYVLAVAKGGGDCPAEPKSAALLARRILELRVSCIIDIYELSPTDRKRFVRLFLESLISAPRSLWQSAIVVVDEAHKFCPEKEEAESAGAVIDLMTLGRKRGFCGVLATQRISKLSKDAAAECNNKIIGRASLDVDMARAADELGFRGKDQQQQLRQLEPGEFFVFGPAISPTVERVKIGKVKTTHPEPGTAALVEPTAPRARIKAVLAKLADIPAEAAQEAKDVPTLRAQVAQLKRQLEAKAPVAPAAPVKAEPDVAALSVAWNAGWAGGKVEGWNEATVIARAWVENVQKGVQDAKAAVVGLLVSRKAPKGVQPPQASAQVARAPQAPRPAPPIGMDRAQPPAIIRPAQLQPMRPAAETVGGESLPPGERAVLGALIQYPDGLRSDQLSVITGYPRSTRNTYLSRLKVRGYCEGTGDQMKATAEGVAALPDFEPLPTGEALRQHWLNKLPPGEAKILAALIENHPNPLSRDQLTELTGYPRSTRNTYLSRMIARQVVETRGQDVTASSTLF